VYINQISSKLSSIDYSKLSLELSDNGIHGNFKLIEGHDKDRFIYQYQAPEYVVGTVEISAKLIYNNEEVATEKIDIKVIEKLDGSEKIQEKSKEEPDTSYYLIFIPIISFILIILITLGFSLIQKRKSLKKK